MSLATFYKQTFEPTSFDSWVYANDEHFITDHPSLKEDIGPNVSTDRLRSQISLITNVTFVHNYHPHPAHKRRPIPFTRSICSEQFCDHILTSVRSNVEIGLLFSRVFLLGCLLIAPNCLMEKVALMSRPGWLNVAVWTKNWGGSVTPRFLPQPLPVGGWTLAFILNFHRLCCAIEGRLNHFQPRWPRTGWQPGKIPWNTPSRPEIEPSHWEVNLESLISTPG